MARELPPEGAWVTCAVSLRSAHVDLLDAARGDLTRSEWLRKVVLAALAVEKAAQAPARKNAAPATRPRGAPAAGELANERDAREDAKPALAVPEPPVAGYTYPDVRNVAGTVVCRKCG